MSSGSFCLRRGHLYVIVSSHNSPRSMAMRVHMFTPSSVLNRRLFPFSCLLTIMCGSPLRVVKWNAITVGISIMIMPAVLRLLFKMFSILPISFLNPLKTLMAFDFLIVPHLFSIPAVGGIVRKRRNATRAMNSFNGPRPCSIPSENLFVSCCTVDTRFLSRFSILKGVFLAFFRWLFIRDLLSN